MNEYTYPFQTAYTQALELYGVELDLEEFESIGMIAWGKIGNKQTALYRIAAKPEKLDHHQWHIELPCNADIIESVTSNIEDWTKTSSIHSVNGNQSAGNVENYIEQGKRNTGSLYSSGGYINYRRMQNTLIFDEPYDTVYILYKGYVADEEGLPYITEKEVDAIAAFCAYTSDLKAARLARDRNAMEFMGYMEQKWKQLCTQARVPAYINQNQMDQILDVMTSWDRKRFGKSFKPLR